MAVEEAIWEESKTSEKKLFRVSLERVLKIHYFGDFCNSCVSYMNFFSILPQSRHSKWALGFWLFLNWPTQAKLF